MNISARHAFNSLASFFTGIVLFAGIASIAQAQSYPARSVRLIVTTAPGGGLDLMARVMAGKLGELWGQPVVVENRPGAGFVIGTDAVAKATPDGYTIGFTSSAALTINPVTMSSLPYKLEDLIPVTLTTANPFVLTVNSNVPANNVQELLIHLRANPGKLNHASNSASTLLASALFKALGNVDYIDVSYKAAAPAMASTTAGETELCFIDMATSSAAVKTGRVRALAVTTAQRYKLATQIPTLAEAGVPGYSMSAWGVLMAPAGTPADIVAKINTDIRRALALPEVVSRIEAVGNEVIGTSTEDAMRLLKLDAEKWAKLVRERNIRFGN